MQTQWYNAGYNDVLIKVGFEKMAAPPRFIGKALGGIKNLFRRGAKAAPMVRAPAANTAQRSMGVAGKVRAVPPARPAPMVKMPPVKKGPAPMAKITPGNSAPKSMGTASQIKPVPAPKPPGSKSLSQSMPGQREQVYPGTGQGSILRSRNLPSNPSKITNIRAAGSSGAGTLTAAAERKPMGKWEKRLLGGGAAAGLGALGYKAMTSQPTGAMPQQYYGD